MVSVFKKIWHFINPDNTLLNSRKRRWEEDDGTNTPGLPTYSYKMPKYSDPAAVETFTPLSRGRKHNLKETKQTQYKDIRTIFVNTGSKKENMAEDEVTFLGTTSKNASFGRVGASVVPQRMPLTSRQQDEVVIEYDRLRTSQPSTSSAAPAASNIFGGGEVVTSSWLKPKPRPVHRFCLPESSVSRIMKQKKLKSSTIPKNPFIESIKRRSIFNSTLSDCYQLDEKKKYSDMLKSFLADTNLVRFLSKKPAKPTTPSHKGESIELIDLTLTEDDNIEIKKSITEFGGSPAEDRTPRTKDLAKEKEAEEEVLILSSAEVPRKNTLAESLATRAAFQEKWIPELIGEFEEKNRILENEVKKETERLKLLEEKSKEQFEEKYIDRVRKQIEIFDLTKEEEEIEEIEEEFPELSEEAEALVNRAFFSKPPSEVLVSAFNKNLTRHDISTLKGLQWLNDEVINFYMDLIVERGKLDNYPSVYAFNTFFFPKIMSTGHSSVSRWTRKVDIFSYEILLMPVHLGMHWCMIIIDLPSKTITYYDSMGGPDRGALEKILKYLVDETKDKKKQVFDRSGWQLVTAKDIPHQMNGSDCGMFSCMFAETVSRRKEINFTQEHMPYFRRRMAYEILTKQLLV